MTTRLTNKETKLDEVNILEEFNASLKCKTKYFYSPINLMRQEGIYNVGLFQDSIFLCVARLKGVKMAFFKSSGQNYETDQGSSIKSHQ